MDDRNLIQRFGALLIFAAAAMFLSSPGPAHAVSPQSANGIAYVTGGVGLEERDEMQGMRKDYSLLLKMAAKSGHYLGETRVTITGADKGTVFEATTDGPWLLVNLPPGNYTLNVSGLGKTKVVNTHIGRNDHRNLLMVWDTPVQD